LTEHHVTDSETGLACYSSRDDCRIRKSTFTGINRILIIVWPSFHRIACSGTHILDSVPQSCYSGLCFRHWSKKPGLRDSRMDVFLPQIGFTTGRWPPRTARGTGCLSAGPCSRVRKATSSWPFTAAGHRGRSLSPSLPLSPGRAGEWRTASLRPRTRPAWTTIRSAGTTPGTGTPPCPCSRTPSSPSPRMPPGPHRRPRSRRHLLPPAETRTADLPKGDLTAVDNSSPRQEHTPRQPS
jgi:hypothetical protein